MKDGTRSLLIRQGYSEADICDCKQIATLARWTPASCAVAGAIGLALQSPAYMIVLGALTFIGAIGPHSFFDYVYMYLVKPFLNLGDMPSHGNPRRFGCFIGAGLFTASAIGLRLGNGGLAYIPSVTIIALAAVAAITQWCFASALYSRLWHKATEYR
jgi:hypothetical protein